MNQITQIKQKTLSSQVENYILQLITKKKLTSGMPVPSELQLIQTLGVSRGIVREAYRSLASLGVIETQSGKIPRVRRIDSNVLQFIFNFAVVTEQVSIQDILVVRKTLEIETVQLAAKNGSVDDFQLLRQEMDLMRKNFQDINMFIKHDLQFHFILSKAANNSLISILLQSLHKQLSDSMSAGLIAQKGKKNLESEIITIHQTICDMVCQRKVDKAIDAMNKHFDNPFNALFH